MPKCYTARYGKFSTGAVAGEYTHLQAVLSATARCNATAGAFLRAKGRSRFDALTSGLLQAPASSGGGLLTVVNVYYKLEKIAFARYTKFLDAKEDTRLTQGEEIGNITGNISFVNTGFHYDGREIFNGFSLHIEQGKTTALVGESGSGKSTAVKLIAGLLQPHSGRIVEQGSFIELIENRQSFFELYNRTAI